MLVFQVIRALEGSRKVCFADGAVFIVAGHPVADLYITMGELPKDVEVQCWCVVGRH